MTIVLQVLAAICFFLAANFAITRNINTRSINLLALGLLFLTLSFLL